MVAMADFEVSFFYYYTLILYSYNHKDMYMDASIKFTVKNSQVDVNLKKYILLYKNLTT